MHKSTNIQEREDYKAGLTVTFLGVLGVIALLAVSTFMYSAVASGTNVLSDSWYAHTGLVNGIMSTVGFFVIMVVAVIALAWLLKIIHEKASVGVTRLGHAVNTAKDYTASSTKAGITKLGHKANQIKDDRHD